MSDRESRKTLTLKPVRPQGRDDKDDTSPGRSGARARQSALRARAAQAQERAQKHARKQEDAAATQQPGRRAAPASRRPQAAPIDARAPRRPISRSLHAADLRDPDTIHDAYAPCPTGLEAALAQELESLGYTQVVQGRAGCHFRSDWRGILRANLQSRLATRILVQVAKAPVRTEDDILELARATPWENWFGPEHTLRLDTSAIRSPMRSLQYCNLRAKDGVCDRLRELEGARPSIDTVRPDARIHQFLDADTTTLYMDTSGESLFKRGWRLDKGQAPLRENLAAGLLALAGWDGQTPLLDPFCGSGTLLIEAAWKAMRIPPGMWRPFAFQRLRGHDDALWQALRDEAGAHMLSGPPVPLAGYDIDPGAIAAACHNRTRAHLQPDHIHFEQGDALTLVPPFERGTILSNPPYGERMADSDALWLEWGNHLKQQYDGWTVHMISSQLDLPGRLRLKAGRRRPVFNGALECRLFSFEMTAPAPGNPP